MSVLSLRGWPGDGVIASVLTKREAIAAAGLGIPVVNFSGTLADAGLPRVMNDQRAIGRLGAEHLLQCGFRHFAYYGLKHSWYSSERCQAFAECVGQQGYRCEILETTSTGQSKNTWHHWQEELRRWMTPFERPFGIMAATDVLARMVTDTCRQLEWHVPHDVAVIGAGNNLLICEGSQPPLSSVAFAGKEIGYRAARLLDQLMSGKQPPKHDIAIAPTGVVARQSTNVVAVEDPDLSLAMRFVHDHLAQPFSVDDLVGDITVSRRWLEYRFREALGCSPHEYICRARVERAKQLLLEPRRLRSEALARECGFSGVRNLHRVFRRLTAMTPAQYRRRELAKRPRCESDGK